MPRRNPRTHHHPESRDQSEHANASSSPAPSLPVPSLSNGSNQSTVSPLSQTAHRLIHTAFSPAQLLHLPLLQPTCQLAARGESPARPSAADFDCGQGETTSHIGKEIWRGGGTQAAIEIRKLGPRDFHHGLLGEIPGRKQGDFVQKRGEKREKKGRFQGGFGVASKRQICPKPLSILNPRQPTQFCAHSSPKPRPSCFQSPAPDHAMGPWVLGFCLPLGLGHSGPFTSSLRRFVAVLPNCPPPPPRHLLFPPPFPSPPPHPPCPTPMTSS